MLKSMTAFARYAEQNSWGEAVWELRSLNHRYLEITIRLPDDLRELEMALRERIRQNIERGKIECSLKYQPRWGTMTQVTLNTALLTQLANAAKQIETLFPNIAAATAVEILAWPGVIQLQETDSTALQQSLLHSFDHALSDLITYRTREGQSIQQLMEERLQNILSEVDKVKRRLPQVLIHQRKKLIERFNEAKLELNSERIEQEIVLLAQRMDVAEEVERLQIHVKEAMHILRKCGTACGRRLDFLMQELGREANTLASKSVDIETSSVAMELKVLVEQIREQVQNLE